METPNRAGNQTGRKEQNMRTITIQISDDDYQDLVEHIAARDQMVRTFGADYVRKIHHCVHCVRLGHAVIEQSLFDAPDDGVDEAAEEGVAIAGHGVGFMSTASGAPRGGAHQCLGKCGGANRCPDIVYHNGYCKEPKLRSQS